MTTVIGPADPALEVPSRLNLAYWWRLDDKNEASLAINAHVQRPKWPDSRSLQIEHSGSGRYKLTGYGVSGGPLGDDSDSLALAAHFARLTPMFECLDAEVVPVLSIAAGLIPELSAAFGLAYERPRCALFELEVEVSGSEAPLVTRAGLLVDDASHKLPAVLAWNYGRTDAGKIISGWTDRVERATLKLAESLYRSEVQAAMVPRFETALYRLFDQASGRIRL